MSVKVINIKIRPNDSIPFKDPTITENHGTWPGFIEGVTISLSNQDLIQTLVTRWSSKEHYLNPNLSEEQKAIKLASDQWLVNNNIKSVVDFIEE